MWGLFFKVILVLLAIVGVMELFRSFFFWLLRTKNSGKIYWVLSFKGHDEEAEIALKNAVEKLRWFGGTQEKEVICIDRGMDEETKEVCMIVCEETPGMELVQPEEAAERLAQEFANT